MYKSRYGNSRTIYLSTKKECYFTFTFEKVKSCAEIQELFLPKFWLPKSSTAKQQTAIFYSYRYHKFVGSNWWIKDLHCTKRFTYLHADNSIINVETEHINPPLYLPTRWGSWKKMIHRHRPITSNTFVGIFILYNVYGNASSYEDPQAEFFEALGANNIFEVKAKKTGAQYPYSNRCKFWPEEPLQSSAYDGVSSSKVKVSYFLSYHQHVTMYY